MQIGELPALARAVLGAAFGVPALFVALIGIALLAWRGGQIGPARTVCALVVAVSGR